MNKDQAMSPPSGGGGFTVSGGTRLWRVAAGIIWRQGMCLLAERPAGTLMSGYYEFPGGKIEPGETSYEAVVRELREELNIVVLRAQYWRTVEYGEREWRGAAESGPGGPEEWRVNIDFFHVVEYTGKLRANEGQKWLFVKPEHMSRYNLLPANIPLARDLPRVSRMF